MPLHWLSTTRMTVGVETDAEGIIIDAPPIVRRFMGQYFDRLRAWMSRQPAFCEEAVPENMPVGAPGSHPDRSGPLR